MMQLWNNLTTTKANVRQIISKGLISSLRQEGDVISFGGIRNEALVSQTGVSDENDAVYIAATTSYNKTNELYQGAGFFTYLPCDRREIEYWERWLQRVKE
jgi:hypothetical protein